LPEFDDDSDDGWKEDEEDVLVSFLLAMVSKEACVA
jgi:hypothetical protein